MVRQSLASWKNIRMQLLTFATTQAFLSKIFFNRCSNSKKPLTPQQISENYGSIINMPELHVYLVTSSFENILSAISSTLVFAILEAISNTVIDCAKLLRAPILFDTSRTTESLFIFDLNILTLLINFNDTSKGFWQIFHHLLSYAFSI